MKDCPECKTPVDGLVCRGCGYAEPRPPQDTVAATQSCGPIVPMPTELRPHIKAALHHITTPPAGIEREWARKILARQQAGETMPFISICMAREALGLSQFREPGEEG